MTCTTSTTAGRTSTGPCARSSTRREAKKAPLVEIIPGKGSGQLKKHVLRFLEQKEIKAKYHRVEKDSKNFGRLFVHFRWWAGQHRGLP